MSLLNERRSRPVASDQRWWALVLLAMADFVVILDASIVNTALPWIGRGLHISLANLSWVVNAYVLTFGGFVLLGGRIADRLGPSLLMGDCADVAAVPHPRGSHATEIPQRDRSEEVAWTRSGT